MEEKPRVTIIDFLRALASLYVCFFHFGTQIFNEGWLFNLANYGWLGIHVFFVVSGFVIPLSMHNGKFNLLVDWKTFFGKRIIRLDLPYLASIFLTIGLWYLSSLAPSFQGKSPTISTIQLIAHLGYINSFLGFEWINPVYWTLGIEFQFYIIIALSYFLIASPNKQISQLSILTMAILSFLPTTIKGQFAFGFMGLFSFGIATFQYHTRLIGRNLFFIQLTILTILCISQFGYEVGITGFLTSIIITFVRFSLPKFISFLALISYSIYLIHVPIGGRVINFGKRFANSLPSQILVLTLAFIITIASAYIFYLCIERASKIWSSSLKYASKDLSENSLKF